MVNDLKEIQTEPINGVYVELIDNNLYKWKIFFEGTRDTVFAEGIYEATLEFPETYPDNPPVMTILSKFWHPNVYEDGKLCISVLHTTGEDPLNELETTEMRWLPSHSPSSILRCFLSILDAPGGAPANPDAQRQYNSDNAGYSERVRKLAVEARASVPPAIIKLIPHPDTDPDDPSYKKRIRTQRVATGQPEMTAEEKLAEMEEDYEVDGGEDYDYDYAQDQVEYEEDENY
uniref:UBC core domain-containing protein n=1 Tax=Arcella intermedia TaxID=1963864 RepID=A0A6B2LHB3_9EUKA